MRISREKAEEILEWAATQHGGRWVGHSRKVAEMAEKVAEKCGMDAEKAYCLGLLHDIGRYEGNTGSRHMVGGYELMREKGYDEVARICLTHSFYWIEDEEISQKYWKTLWEEDRAVLQPFMENTELDDYDKLTQLADLMALDVGVMTINERFGELLLRYEIEDASKHMLMLRRLKKYFDSKAGMNIYELFREDIIRTTIAEPWGNWEE